MALPTIIIGIQGGKGSFSEQAALHYVKQNEITSYKLKYLYTAQNVLHTLSKKEIDLGVVAIHNSTGGIVHETVQAMGKYYFGITEEFAIKISHSLMIRKDASLTDITIIMTHPQVLAQCKQTLLSKYPNLTQTSGEGEMVDHALVAKKLSEANLPKNTATMGSSVLADLYGIQVVEDNLQDLKDNYTSFLLINNLN